MAPGKRVVGRAAVRAIALVTVVALAAVAAGCGGDGERTAVPVTQPAPPTTRTTIAGARPEERRALRLLLAELGPTQIRRIGVMPVPRARRDRLPPGAVTLTFAAGTSVRGQWEAMLLGGHYAVEARRLHLRPAALLHVGDTGTHIRPARPESRPANLAPIREVLRAANARLVAVSRPLGAIAVTIHTDDPAVFLKHYGQGFLRALGESRASARRYWALEDEDGSIVYAGATLPGVGMMAARADLDACGPIQHSQLITSAPPPCAA